MITLNLKNKYIYFCVSGIYRMLDPRFATKLWELVTANSDDEYVQTVEVPKSQLMLLYQNTSMQSEGVAASINKELNDLLLPQLMQQGQLDMAKVGQLQQVVANNENIPEEFLDNEAAEILYAIFQFNMINAKTKQEKIQSGKNQILTPYV